MEQDKAIALKNFIDDAYSTFISLINFRYRDKVEIDAAKARFTSEQFAAHYDAFIKELDSNILKYKDYQLIRKYIENNFYNIFRIDCKNEENYQKLFRNSIDIRFNTEVLQNVLKYKDLILKFRDSDYNNKPYGNLYPYFKKIANVELNFDAIPDFNEVYDIKWLKDKCYNYDIPEKIKLFTEALYNFKQWQIYYDEKIETENGIRYKYSDIYYPNFEALCNLELEKLNKLLEMEQLENDITQPPVQNFSEDAPPPYRWNSSDTDLIELLTALFHSNAIKRRDNKKITRKELMNYFQEIFDIQLKDPEGMLSRATNRKKTMTPYIDKLKLAFENYAEGKVEKQSKR